MNEEFDNEVHDMFDCDCNLCEHKLLMHYESLSSKEEDEEYYRCVGFVNGKLTFEKVDL